MITASAASAGSESSPSTDTVICEPLAAARVSTPMMLFPFTSMPSFSISTSERKRLAACTSWAAARACSPRVFEITKVRAWRDIG